MNKLFKVGICLIAVFHCACNERKSEDRKRVGLADPENKIIRGRLLDEGSPMGFVTSAEFVAKRDGAMNRAADSRSEVSYILINVISDGSIDFNRGVSLLLGNDRFEVNRVSELRATAGEPIEQSIRFDIPEESASELLSEKEGVILFNGKKAVVFSEVNLTEIRKYWIEFSDRKRDEFNYVVPFSEMKKNVSGASP